MLRTGKAGMFRTACIGVLALVGLGVAHIGSAKETGADAERCRAADALVHHIAHIVDESDAALGGRAPNLRGVPEISVSGLWPSGSPPREIMVGLYDEHPRSALECSSVKELASKIGWAVADGEAANSGTATYIVRASLPTLSADGKSAASVINVTRRWHGSTMILTLDKEAGEWKVGGGFVFSSG